MRDRVEFSGAEITVAVLAVVGLVILGLWLAPWSAAVTLVGGALVLIAALTILSTGRSREPAADAPRVKPARDGHERLLVVADAHGGESDLVEAVRTRGGGRPVSVFVTAPVHESKLGLLTSDQHGYDDATRRLDAALGALQAAGLQARGEVGADDPLQAVDDGLRLFPADRILFVTDPAGQAGEYDDGLLDKASARYQQPVDHIAVTGQTSI
jgi:hypothetical protein